MGQIMAWNYRVPRPFTRDRRWLGGFCNISSTSEEFNLKLSQNSELSDNVSKARIR